MGTECWGACGERMAHASHLEGSGLPGSERAAGLRKQQEDEEAGLNAEHGDTKRCTFFNEHEIVDDLRFVHGAISVIGSRTHSDPRTLVH